MTASDARYWSIVGESWAGAGRDALWRQHCDAVNARLIERWLPRSVAARLLKTDLFDEALTGGHARRLRERAGLVVGVDLSQALARQAASRCPDLRCLRTDVRQLPFTAGAFDTVVSLSTLDHFRTEDELAASLRELGRILRPRGLLLLTMDNPANPLVGLRNALPFDLLSRLGIVPYFVGATAKADKLGSLLRDASFDLLETTSILHCVRVLAVPLCRLVDRANVTLARRALLRLLLGTERLARLPTGQLTGNFVALLARKTGS